MGLYTIVGIHNNGLGLVIHSEANNAKEAMENFDSLNEGMVIAVFKGHLFNRVKRNLISNNTTSLEE